MQFTQTIADIDRELTPQRIVELYKAARARGFEPGAERCVALIFPSSAAMLRTVRGGEADPVVAEAWTLDQMQQAFPRNIQTLAAFETRPSALLIATAVHLPLDAFGLGSDKLFTVSITCANPRD